MRNLWKKSFALIGVLALLLALAACSGAEEADATSAPETQSTTEAEPETTTQPETEEEPEEKAQDDDDPSQTPSVEAAIQMYREAGKKTKTADSFTARKEQSSAIKIATGKSALGMDIDKEFNDAMSVTLTASLAKNGDTYAVTKTKTGDDAKYYEYGTGDTVEFSNPNGYHEIDKSGSASVSTLSSQLKESDMLKMTLASNPENFMPLSGSSEIGAFTKDDVESFDYKYDAAAKEKTLTFQLKASAIDKAMDTVDVKAMQAKPATMDAGFATITMTFNSVVLTYETVSVEMKINADGYMTALETKFATNKSASSLDVGVTLLGNMKSDTLDAALTTVYTFEKIGSTEKPAKPF